MPVAGIDEGTLRRRFTEGDSVGSVIAKTGTLPNTDSGVSSLVGIMATKSGDFMYFVIFNQRGNVNRFRSFQDSFVLKMQNMKGGPTRFQYLAKTFPTLLANTKVNIPSNRPRIAQ
jgi:D-alanyl-D-alanine carboxypeptidase